MKRILIAIAVCLTVATACRAADVKETWDKNCANCHGKDGKGGTKAGRMADVKDFTDAKVQAEIKDDKALTSLKEGIKDKDGKDRMKPFKEVLKDEEIKELIAYVRTFKPK